MEDSRKEDLSALLAKLRQASGVVIVSHQRPDADAHGSALGLYHVLKKTGIEALYYYNADGIEGKFLALPGSDVVTGSLETIEKEALTCCDTIIFVDCATRERVGKEALEVLERFPVVMNIDHHFSNSRFGDYRFIDEHASSTSEMIGRLAKEIGVKLCPTIGTNLLAGIYGDTGSLRYSNTSPSTLEMVAELLTAGADLQLVSNSIIFSVSKDVFLFQMNVLSRAEFSDKGEIALVVVETSDLERFKADQEGTEGIVERLRDIDGVLVSFIMRQTAEGWRVSLRSKSPEHDVSSVASSFGGGGHKCAAAFRHAPVAVESLKSKILDLLKKVID